MELRILGPIEVLADERPVPLGGPRQRALLAYLLLHANEVVPADRLLDRLWDDPPGLPALHSQVARLRRVVGDRIVTAGQGYAIRVEPGELDLDVFRALLADAGAAADPVERSRLLRDADALWRGDPLAGLDVPFAAGEAAALEELRLAALEDRIEADLAAGLDADLVPELATLVARHPLRERLRGELILALYRSGRQADALETYQETRRMLDEELGLEPSPALRELERGILRHDPALALDADRDAAAAPARDRRPWRAVALVLAALAVVAAASSAALVVSAGSASSPHAARRQSPFATMSAAALAAARLPSSWTTLRDDFSGKRLDLTLWGSNLDGKGASLAVRHGRVELTLAAGGRTGGRYHQISAALFTQCRFNGDFDTRVHFRLLDWPPRNGARAQLSAWIFPASDSDVARSSAPAGEQYDGDMPTTYGYDWTTDRAGTFRVLRRDGRMAAYFRRHGKWIELDSQRAHGQVTVGLQLFAQSSDWAHHTVKVAFDGFRVSAPTMQCA